MPVTGMRMPAIAVIMRTPIAGGDDDRGAIGDRGAVIGRRRGIDRGGAGGNGRSDRGADDGTADQCGDNIVASGRLGERSGYQGSGDESGTSDFTQHDRYSKQTLDSGSMGKVLVAADG
jgi:hypothetical protein